MNHSPENQNPHPQPAIPGPTPADEPAGWLDSVALLVASRIALIQFEARASARHAALRVAKIAAAALCLLFAWILLVAGGIGLLAAATGWPWHWLAIITAVIHLIATFALLARHKPGEPAFPLTRAEFEKDRQWLETLKKKNASGN
ncbi:MAG TPA: phage holin family protein [Luteolibacter sp.]|nr:phage holin family protein [Luteolibacter sp.]